MEFTPENLESVQQILRGKATVKLDLPAKATLPPVEPDDNKNVSEFKKWMEHTRYSLSSITTYCRILMVFIRFIKPKKIAEAENDDVVRFTNE